MKELEKFYVEQERLRGEIKRLDERISKIQEKGTGFYYAELEKAQIHVVIIKLLNYLGLELVHDKHAWDKFIIKKRKNK